MPASTPEEIPVLLAAAMNGGDLDAFVELYEPDATTVVPPEGKLVNGRAEIRAALEPIFASRPLEGSDSDGQAIELAGRGTIVSRRQPDGRWLVALENTLSPA
jgi:uncharacterized protein (TIGR02246 family)